MPAARSAPHAAAAAAVLDPLRLAALRRTALLDSAAEDAFDRFARLASRVLGVPVALVSLVDADRQFFKSAVGLPEPWASARETPLSHSFCQHVIARGGPLAVGDARRDPVLHGNGATADLDVVAYLGVPIEADSQVIGSLCAIDGRPRVWTDADTDALTDLAEAVRCEVALRAALADAREAGRTTNLLLSASADAFLAVDAAGRCTYASPRAARYLGVPAADLLGAPLLDRLPSDDRGRAVALLARVRARGAPVEDEFVVGSTDASRPSGAGTARRLAVRVVPAPDGGITAALRDVTARHAAEDAVRESEHRFRAVTASAADAIISADAAGRIVHWNAAAARVFGYTEAEALGRSLSMLVPEELRAAHAAGLARMAAGGAPRLVGKTVEVTGVRQDGARFPMELALSQWEAGGRPFFTSVIRDVSTRKEAERALARSRALLEATLDATTDAILVLDDAGRVSRYNEQFLELWGLEPAATAVSDAIELRDVAAGCLADPEAFLASAAALARDPDTVLDDVLAFADGRVVERHSHPQRVDGAVVGRAFRFRDVTERVRTAETVAQSEARLRLALEAARMTVWERHLDGDRVVFRGGAAASPPGGGGPSTTAHTEAKAAQEFLATVHPDDRERVLAASRRARAECGLLDVEFRHAAPDGSWRWRQTTGRVFPATAHGPARMVGVDMDVTERKRLEAALAYQAFHDPLTGLANRALFRDRVEHALARVASARGGRAESVAVLYLDLDDFKAVNDAFGHDRGDALLREVAERLRKATRGFDTVARLGGDEFAVLLEGMAGPGDADVVLARVAQVLATPVVLDGREVSVRASVGLAHAVGADDAEALVRNADVAMYEVKAAGKGGHAVFAPAMRDAVVARRALEQDLRAAVAAATAEPGAGAPHAFRVVFQPVVAVETGAVVKFEALLRWQHAERGAVSPAAFVPLAEETGLIVPLGRWVLGEACRQLRAWDGAGLAAAHVAVNVSGRQLEDPDLVADVAAALAAVGLAPDRLTLEVTETALMRDTERTLAALHALKALGVRLAVDDFGTGYSSLAYLQRFPVDVLKIDKAFVDGVADEVGDRAIARTVIALGQTLGLRTVAEGVETEAQRAALAALGCELAQGYLFARPLEAAAAGALLAPAAAAAAAAPGAAALLR